MSGHSKWATIKHKKGAVDKARGKLFAKLIRQIEVAAREGGGDPSANATLRTMIQKARDASVPQATIERAIKRGTGELEGARYEQVSYEGYAPGGVAIMVSCLTDNRNRTGAEVRTAFSRNGGSLAEPGAVSWQFHRRGQIRVSREADEDELLQAALAAGAEDVVDEQDAWLVTTQPTDLAGVRDALDAAGFAVESAEIELVPQTVVPVEDPNEARRVLKLVEALEDLDDVQEVTANFDMPEALLEELAAE
jgi:YebC/PmpR family DNA-binding regulatory protein